MLRLHTEAALLQAGVGGGGKWGGVFCQPREMPGHQGYRPPRAWGQASGADSCTNPRQGGGPQLGALRLAPGGGHASCPYQTPACTFSLPAWLWNTLVWVYTRNDFSWCYFHGRCQRIEEERWQPSFSTAPRLWHWKACNISLCNWKGRRIFFN